MLHLSKLLWIAALLRGGLLLFGEVQDRCLQVKYTDVDYQVFTDAARFVSQGGSPYERSTYRYSPLLAYLLLPNIWASSCFGKVLFSIGDIVAGWIIARLVRLQGASAKATTAAAALWLFNPWTFTISTRGSCDVLVVLLLLWLLLCLHEGALISAAVVYGLAVHLRIYPIIYVPAIVLFLAARAARLGPQQPGSVPPQAWGRLAHKIRQVLIQGVRFGALSGSVFVGLHLLFYHIYGEPYLHEAFLHHLTRKDHRHNFSIYYYSIYLSYADHHDSGAVPARPPVSSAGATAAFLSSLASQPAQQLLAAAAQAVRSIDLSRVLLQPATAAFLPQFAILASMSLKLHEHLPLCCLLQTICFVAFNKVCTAQYFVWWMCLLPLVLPRIPWPPPPPLLKAAAFWGVMQLHWLAWAYLLEFQGLPVHLGVWFASLLFLASNVVLAVQLLRHVNKASSFLAQSLLSRGVDGGASGVAVDAGCREGNQQRLQKHKDL